MTGKTILSGAVIAAMLAAGGVSIAQTQTETENRMQTQTQMENRAVEFISQQQAGEVLATAMIGLNVHSAAEENIGSVNDLVVGPNGNVTGAVIGVGGFLGIGEKNVAISYDDMRLESEDDEVVVRLAATKAELEAAPDYRGIDNEPLSVSKKLTDQAIEQYNKAKEQASKAYQDAKERVSN